MNFKKILTIALVGLLLSACGAKKESTDNQKNNPATSKVLLNELAFADRPFVALVPHSTNRLFTFYGQNLNKATEASIDLEYQSGDLLKGIKANIEVPIADKYMKGIILGSCSTGGKCSFDKDLKTGTTKLRMKFAGKSETHLLKGDFTFVLGQPNLPDGKVNFMPTKNSAKDNLIMMNSFGLPIAFDKEVVLYPVVFSATSDKVISGELSLAAPTATSALIYDGNNFVPLKSTVKDGNVVISLNQKPWTMSAEIIRDDEKGSKENLNLYLVGPIVLTK